MSDAGARFANFRCGDEVEGLMAVGRFSSSAWFCLGCSFTSSSGSRLMTGSKMKTLTLAIALPDEKWL
jgi:hypothetical protein